MDTNEVIDHFPTGTAASHWAMWHDDALIAESSSQFPNGIAASRWATQHDAPVAGSSSQFPSGINSSHWAPRTRDGN